MRVIRVLLVSDSYGCLEFTEEINVEQILSGSLKKRF